MLVRAAYLGGINGLHCLWLHHGATIGGGHLANLRDTRHTQKTRPRHGGARRIFEVNAGTGIHKQEGVV